MNPTEKHRQYYAETASTYDESHHGERGEHDVALDYIIAQARTLGVTSILDVGAGTGRQVATLREALPGVQIVGIEPVPELVEVGRRTYSLGEDNLVVGDGLKLPFQDASFDFVIETGVLHHTPRPRAMILEMARVARRGVFLSDANRFGQGRPLARLAKLGIYMSGMWPTFYRLKTRGRNFEESVGDGVYYSFSIYDDLDVLQAWSDRLWIVPTMQPTETDRRLARWFGTLLGAPHGLVCAVRDVPAL